MKRIDLYKNASDFAAANYATSDLAALSIAKGQAFQAAKFDPADFTLWSGYVDNQMNQYRVLAQQDTPSTAKAANAAPAPMPRSAPEIQPAGTQ